MSEKIRVGVLCGGVSCEHEVSLVSAKNVLSGLNPAKYDPVAIYIDKNGRWLEVSPLALLDAPAQALLTGDVKIDIAQSTKELVRLPEAPLDVVFPVLHGPYGEDGTVQGFLKLAKVAFVGADVCGSSIGMDKDIQKRILRDAGLPIVRFKTLYKRDVNRIDADALISELGSTLFVKPANLGSSVGITKAKNAIELRCAIEKAFTYDHKVLVEECIVGREIDCAVLGNDHPIASVPGEISTSFEFYNFEAKYLDEKLKIQIPAPISDIETRQIQELAIQAFEVLSCAGMARVDFFLATDGQIYVNELNTIPGFTNTSMYPKLFEASGISYAELLDRLIQLAIDRHLSDKHLITSEK